MSKNIRQLAAMGREDIYLEDREERFSASSRGENC